MTLTTSQTVKILLILSAVALIAFLIPFYSFHNGLPTGDSQKSIIWAQQLLATGTFPDYQSAVANLNRDPVDFYTPALHVLTAGLLMIGGLPAVGLFAIAVSIVTALIGSAIAYHILPKNIRSLTAIATFALILTHERFLRYVREPGYHLQNIIGELLLFSLLLLGLLLIDRWRWKIFALAVVLAVVLALSHQFSAFVAAFVLMPIVVALAFKYRRATFALLPVVGIFLIAGVLLGLHEKVPHIFTTTPHLVAQTPSPLKILQLMQPAWLLLGLGGAVILARHAKGNLALLTFLSSTAVLLVLSQGPRFGIDIPPVRALLYSVVPLSITGAYLLSRLWQTGRTGAIFASALVVVFAASSVANAFTLSHTVRTNSTLTPGQLELVSFLKNQTGAGVLIDDYNRRSSSWLVLSGHPMFTRIAADLETQMNEAGQNKLREALYLNQLDFEKIFSLGSRPEISTLMEKHNITWLTGIDGSSVSHFEHNPALQAMKKVDDITLYRSATSPASGTEGNSPGVGAGQDSNRASFTPGEEASSTPGVFPASALTTWLLKPSTLANDIGDFEDTFEHLPASLRTTRLSDPQVINHTTYRSTTAPLIPLTFNVGDYVRVLWDQDSDNLPDASLQLLIQYTDGQEQRKISPRDASIDDRGFITVTIDNPTQKPLAIDLIALGLAHTP